MVIPDVDTTYRKRRANADAIAGWIARLAHPEKNVLALFPSYQFLRMAHDRMPPVPHHVIVQSPGSAEARQHEILDALAGGGSNLVLAVLGGIFAEGIDYPGEMLSQVIIVSPALPQFNTDRQLLRDYFRERYGHGFEYAYLIPGMTRVVQAAGRLIRSDEDRGTIILVGRRFLQPRYLQLLPDEWIDEDPSRLVFEDPEGEVRRFFA
jgi:Rad3-related DNA helicases